jgi:hypothetical protein
MLRVKTPPDPTWAAPSPALPESITHFEHTPGVVVTLTPPSERASAFGPYPQNSDLDYRPATLGNVTTYGTYYTINGYSNSENHSPVQPLYWHTIASAFGKFHGAVILNGRYRIETNFNPVVDEAYDLNATQSFTEPTFQESNYYPATLQVPNELLNRDDSRERQFTTLTGQFNSRDIAARVYETMTVQNYFSSLAEFEPPQIIQVAHTYVNGQLTVTVNLTDPVGLYKVLMVYDPRDLFIYSVELTDANGDGVWTTSLPITSTATYYIQAVDNAGNVALDDNHGQHYAVWQHLYLPLITRSASALAQPEAPAPLSATRPEPPHAAPAKAQWMVRFN